MENGLIKSQLPTNEIMSIGKAFAESGLFPDIKQAAQAIVKIQAGQEMGIAPFAAMTGIHLIQGKPTVGAGIIASRIKASGKYDYKVKELTEKNCSIDFYQGKELIGNSSFSIQDAVKAQTKNIDKFPKNMLFARAISNGVKWYCPDVFSGPVYTPEEMGQVTEDTHAEITTPKEDVTSVVTEPSDIDKEKAPDIQSGDAKNDEGNNHMVKQGAKPWLNPGTEAWTNAFEKMHTGQITMDDILAHYRISVANSKNILNPKFEYNANGNRAAAIPSK